MDKDKLYDAVLGLAIADAIGVPAEFKSRNELKKKPITDMIGGGLWEQPEGTWSDDTAMTLATIDALNINNWEYSEKLLHDIMKNFVNWYHNGELAANKHRFDIGNTCLKAISNYENSNDVYNCGVKGRDCGNGALMRILPAAFIESETKLSVVVTKISSLTHNNDVCNTASIIYIAFLKLLIKHQDKNLAFRELTKKITSSTTPKELLRLSDKRFSKLNEDDIKSTGYVVDTLEAAIWCFLNTDNYKDCILKAVNLGDDTDTVAAVAGGLAGVYYGINERDGIPEEWINRLRDLNTLKSIVYNK